MLYQIKATKNIRVDGFDVIAGDVLAAIESRHSVYVLAQMLRMEQAERCEVEIEVEQKAKPKKASETNANPTVSEPSQAIAETTQNITEPAQVIAETTQVDAQSASDNPTTPTADPKPSPAQKPKRSRK